MDSRLRGNDREYMKNLQKVKLNARLKRHRKVRARINGTKDIPRLSVFRSNKDMFVQLIDDIEGKTLASVGGKEIKEKNKTKLEMAALIGKLIAEKANKIKIKKVVFDRGGYKYHGRVKAVADGAREGGLEF